MSTMDGLPRDRVSYVRDLKDLIISQLQALFGPGNPYFGMFDVMYFKNGPLYVARAIAYDRIAGIDYRHKWTYLLQGDSRHTVFAAYEDLWNVLSRMTRQDVKDMRTNEDTNVLVYRGSHAPFQDFTGLV